MDLKSIPIVQAISERMRYLTARQEVVSQNIANADTPGYQARTMPQQDFSALLSRVNARVGGMPGVAQPTVQFPEAMKSLGSGVAANGTSMRERDVFETKPNGNNVVLEDQLMDLADIQMEYSALTNLYRKQTGMLKVALGRSR